MYDTILNTQALIWDVSEVVTNNEHESSCSPNGESDMSHNH